MLTPEPSPSLVVTLDYFDITLDDAIAQLGGGAQNTLNLCYLTVQDASSDFCQAVHRNPATGSITVPYSLDVLQANIGGLETIGLRSAGRVMDAMWAGAARAAATSTSVRQWTFTDEFTVTPMQAMPAEQERCVGAYGSTCGEPIPELKGVTRFTWTTGPFGVSLRHRFIDSVTTDRYRAAAAARRSRLPAKETLTNPNLDAKNYLDLSATFDFGDKAEIFAGVNNVLDADPPIVVGLGGYGNTFPATYDYAGMTVFLGVNVIVLSASPLA